jgi:hypothetical protein
MDIIIWSFLHFASESAKESTGDVSSLFSETSSIHNVFQAVRVRGTRHARKGSPKASTMTLRDLESRSLSVVSCCMLRLRDPFKKASL